MAAPIHFEHIISPLKHLDQLGKARDMLMWLLRPIVAALSWRVEAIILIAAWVNFELFFLIFLRIGPKRDVLLCGKHAAITSESRLRSCRVIILRNLTKLTWLVHPHTITSWSDYNRTVVFIRPRFEFR